MTYTQISEPNPDNPKQPKLRLVWQPKAYVPKVPEADADKAAVARAQAKRERRLARNMKLGNR